MRGTRWWSAAGFKTPPSLAQSGNLRSKFVALQSHREELHTVLTTERRPRQVTCIVASVLQPNFLRYNKMSSEKRAAGDSFASSQLVKRQRSDANLSSSLTVANGQNGALVQSVSCNRFLRSSLHGAKARLKGKQWLMGGGLIGLSK